MIPKMDTDKEIKQFVESVIDSARISAMANCAAKDFALDMMALCKKHKIDCFFGSGDHAIASFKDGTEIIIDDLQ